MDFIGILALLVIMIFDPIKNKVINFIVVIILVMAVIHGMLQPPAYYFLTKF